VIGSGYIGLEVADALTQRGVQVTVLERSDSVLDGFEALIVEKIEAVLEAHGVRLRKSCAVTSITAGDKEVHVHVGDTSESADVVLLTVGIRPRASLAGAGGIELGSTGAIAVDERMLTNLNSIYAAGDCTEVRHLITGRPVYFPLGTTANKQGRVAGENAGGGNSRFAGIVGTLATKIFELEVARTGLSAMQARAAGFEPDSVFLHSTSRARYFHGRPLLVGLLWDRPSKRLLGCQMAGEEGVAKRIDVAATALHARMRVPNLLHLDLSYAPPFAPVWEALLIAANEAMKT
jgi:NADPH-dependent 2,4-dienoyl-CoA reductase/sulfur reductase-like enzyme